MQRTAPLLLWSLLTLASCSAPSPDGTGSARVAVLAGALSDDDVADVVLRVSGDGIAPDISQVLTRADSGEFTGRIEGIPAGAARDFDAVARDRQGVALYAGGVAGVPVFAGEEVAVHLLLQQVEPPLPFENGAPRFTSIVASSLVVAPGESIDLWAVAEDLDGDELAYRWTAEAGGFVDEAASSTRWTSPLQSASYAITVSASDPRGAVAEAVFEVEVGTPLDAAAALLAVEVNTAPEIGSLRAEPSRLEVGEGVVLEHDGVDPEGDALSLSWSSDCDGGFSTEGGATVFELVALPPSGWCTLSVVLDDGRGGRNRAALTLATGPSSSVAVAPQPASAPRLVITEVMPNPAALPDGQGEWFELYNAGVEDVDLQGCVLGDAGGASHAIALSVLAAAGEYVVLANDAGAAPGVDYVYAGVGLNNSTESLTFGCDDVVVDTVAWSTSRAGTTLSLDPGALGTASNDDPARWCDAPGSSIYGLGDRGTPGEDNPGCP